jgi:hypothetical protein
MGHHSDFIQNEIQSLDSEIEKARRMMSQLEKEENLINKKNYHVVKVKLANWIEKIDFLVQMLVKRLERR